MLEQALLESYTTPVLAADRELRVRFANPAAGLFWRQRTEQLVDYPLVRLFGERSEVLHHLQRAFDEEVSTTISPCHFEQGPGLPPLNLRVQIDPVLVAHQPVQLGLIVFWDQTQRETLELAATEERLLQSIGAMTQRLAHELQNPLSGIKGATQLLARRVRDRRDLREYPQVILRELERLERLVGRLALQGDDLELSLAPCNLHELLDTVIWFEQNSSPQTEFVREYDPSLPDLVADRDRIHQVFLNLIHNAVEANPRGAPVTIRTRITGPWEQHPALPEPGGTFFLIEVMDCGPGVPDEARANLFTPFFTTKKGGTGLGLSISHQIVRAHHGHLSYRPAPGGGAVFTVALPHGAAP